MGRYRKVEVKIWNDADFQSWSDQGKLAFLFLITHPHMTSLGAMRATIPGLASELGWVEKAFREALREAFRKGSVRVDERASFVWLPKFLNHNRPESPNVIKSWECIVDLLPDCDLKFLMLQEVKELSKALPEAFQKALPKAFRKAMPIPEPLPLPDKQKINNCARELIQEQTPDRQPEIKESKITDDKAEDIYKAYPIKKGRLGALKAIKKALKKRSFDLLLADVMKYAKSVADKDPKYIPYPAKWFNQERWADEPDPIAPQKSTRSTGASLIKPEDEEQYIPPF